MPYVSCTDWYNMPFFFTVTIAEQPTFGPLGALLEATTRPSFSSASHCASRSRTSSSWQHIHAHMHAHQNDKLPATVHTEKQDVGVTFVSFLLRAYPEFVVIGPLYFLLQAACPARQKHPVCLTQQLRILLPLKLVIRWEDAPKPTRIPILKILPPGLFPHPGQEFLLQKNNASCITISTLKFPQSLHDC